MKVITNKSCFSINANDKYLSVIGDDISIYRLKDNVQVCRIKGFRYNNYSEFINENHLMVKNTLGQYRLYNVENSDCLNEIVIGGIEKSAQDVQFIMSQRRKYCFDVLKQETFQKAKIYKIDIERCEVEEFAHVLSSRVIRNLGYDENLNRLYFRNSGAGEKIDGFPTIIDEIIECDFNTQSMKIINSFQNFINNKSLVLFANKFILRQDMSIINIFTGKIDNQVNYNFNLERSEYIANCKIHGNRYIVIATNKRILILDLDSGNLSYEIFKKSNYTCLVGGNLYIGDYDGVYLVENVI